MRNAFSYAVPVRLDERIVPGARVVVPFRNRAVIGLVLERSARRSEIRTLKDVSEVLDPLPALPAHLVELGRWVANYYLAPAGETFRVMLPPAIEVRVSRQWRITESGRIRRSLLQSLDERNEPQAAELAVLDLCEAQPGPVGPQKIRKFAGGEAAAARLLRRGELAAGEVARHRARRMQKVVAWRLTRDQDAAPPESAAPAGLAEERVRRALGERGPLALAELLRIAGVSRSVVERLERRRDVQTWEEPVEAELSVFDAGFSAPSNVLNGEQRLAVEQIRRWMEAGVFGGTDDGVTGSGKTEAIADGGALRDARRCCFRDCAHQMGRLCRAWFGDTVAVLHSALGEPNARGSGGACGAAKRAW
jgi:primosomal protein N' (replication factor Y)